MEPEPVMVRLVLTKSSLVEQLVLPPEWSHGFANPVPAHELTFIGSSFPATGSAARTSFFEALEDIPREDINAVDLSLSNSGAEFARERYRFALGKTFEKQLDFDRAVMDSRSVAAKKNGEAARATSPAPIPAAVATCRRGPGSWRRIWMWITGIGPCRI